MDPYETALCPLKSFRVQEDDRRGKKTELVAQSRYRQPGKSRDSATSTNAHLAQSSAPASLCILSCVGTRDYRLVFARPKPR